MSHVPVVVRSLPEQPAFSPVTVYCRYDAQAADRLPGDEGLRNAWVIPAEVVRGRDGIREIYAVSGVIGVDDIAEWVDDLTKRLRGAGPESTEGR